MTKLELIREYTERVNDVFAGLEINKKFNQKETEAFLSM